MDFQSFLGEMGMRLAFISTVIVAILGLCSLIFTVRRGNRAVVSEQPSAPSSPSPRDGTPSSPSPRDDKTEYDVFLSFSGKDTRNGFTGHLHQALKGKGVRAFIDDEDLKKGERVDQLFGYIKRSRVVVPIFSKRYADSKWCLMEIAKAVECEKLIIPVFFDVDPIDVQHQSGPFETPLKQHQKNESLDQTEVEKWREALRKAGEISGISLTTDTNRHEAKLVQIIVKRILDELNKNTLCVGKYVVGLDKSVKDVINLLDLEADGVRAVGIFGMGGLGKTTLIEAVYNKICSKFDASCFIYSIRSKDIPSLQMQLFHDVFGEDVKINDANRGINLINQRISRNRVLLILDDIDDVEQFSKLAGSTDWFCRGSRIIITTRGKRVLKRAGVNKENIYELETLNEHHSLKLFCYHAFGREEPIEGYEQLSQQVASVAAGLPLALKVFGSLFFDLDNPRKWGIMLEKLPKRQGKEIHESLKISYDGLDEEEKEIFLDIACCLIGENATYATYMWEGCQFYPEIALDVLEHKSLIKISSYNTFVMHDQIRDMGRQIVKQEHGGKNDLRMRSRLWDAKEISSALQNPEGTYNAQAIVLKNTNLDGHPLVCTTAFEMMISKARLLRVNDWVPFEGDGCPCLPSTLAWLQWLDFPFKEFPLAPHLHNIAVLDLSGSNELTCLSLQGLNKLKVLFLKYCNALTVTPDFSSTPHLETLIFQGCEKLVVLHESVGCLKSLVYLCLGGCRDLIELPDSLCQLCSLKKLHLGHTRISSLPNHLWALKALECLDLDCTEIASLPDSMQQMESLISLSLRGCSLLELPEFIGQLTNLQTLNVAWCQQLRVLPKSIGNLRNLTSLNFEGTTIEEIPQSMGLLTNLQMLHAKKCHWLKALPNAISNLRNLRTLDLEETPIEDVPEYIGSLESLEHVDLTNKFGAEPTVVLPTFLPSKSWKTLNLVGRKLAGGMDAVENFGKMSSLRELAFSHCEIESLPSSFGGLSQLEKLTVNHCQGLQFLSPISNLRHLKYLSLDGCRKLADISDIEGLNCLDELSLRGCSGLLSLPQLPTSLLRLDASGCSALRTISGVSNLRHLKYLSLDWCEKLADVSDIEGLNCLEKLSLRGCSGLLSLPQLPTSLFCLNASDCSALRTIPDVSNFRNLFKLNLTNCEKLQDVPGLEYLVQLVKLFVAGCGGGSFLVHHQLCDKINEANFDCLFGFSISGSLSPPRRTELSFLLPKGSIIGKAFLYLETWVAQKKMKEMSICIEEIDSDGSTVSTATAQPPLSFCESLLQLPEEIKTVKLESQYREWKRQRVINVSIQNGLLIGGDLAFHYIDDHRRCVKFTRKQYRSPTNGRVGPSPKILGSCYCVLGVGFHQPSQGIDSLLSLQTQPSLTFMTGPRVTRTIYFH